MSTTFGMLYMRNRVLGAKKGCDLMDTLKPVLRLIGAKVAYYRTLRGLKQQELADLVNVSSSTISKIERGTYNENLSIEMLIVLARGLKVDVGVLLAVSPAELDLLDGDVYG